MNGRDIQHLLYIQRYCRAVAESMGRFGSDYETFANDWDYFQSVSMSVMQIGEHAKSLSDEFTEGTQKQVPWHAIRGARNMVAHEYVKLDKARIWETACRDIPKLRAFCDRMLAENDCSGEQKEAEQPLSVRERLKQKHQPQNQDDPNKQRLCPGKAAAHIHGCRSGL